MYKSACHTEKAIMDAAEYYSIARPRRFVSPFCFILRQPMPMRLVRLVEDVIFPGGVPVSIWEVVDMMRDTEFVMLVSRKTLIQEPESI